MQTWVRRAVLATSTVLAAIALQGCKPEPTGGHTYGATSNEGDFAVWTLEGDQLTVKWNDIDAVGAIERTYDATATCGAAHATYGYRDCTLDTASCTPGGAACDAGGPAVGDVLRVMEIPGTALVVRAHGDVWLSVGFSLGACESFGSEDYSYVNVGLHQRDIFGMFRLASSVDSITHLDFGWTPTTHATPDNIAYVTGSPNGQDAVPPSDCVDGVRTLDVGEAQLRVMVTSAGYLVIDKPEGQGGVVAIKAAMRAQLADLASKALIGIVFPDDGPPEAIAAATGATSGNTLAVQLTGETAGAIGSGTLYAAAAGPKVSATFVDNATNPIASNALHAHYAGPTAVPGLFELDMPGNDELAVVAIAGKSNGKVFLIGAVVNDRDTINEMTGNFILFEK